MTNIIFTGAILLTVILLLSIHYSQSSSVVEGFGMNYYKCKKYGNTKVIQSFLDKHNIGRSDNDKTWDIYMPCGYNYVENELKRVIPNSPHQKIFGINGCDQIVSKNGLWNILETTYGRAVAKRLMPESFILYNDRDMELFIKQYDPTKIYLLKKNIQRKLGILLTRNLDEILSKRGTDFRVVQEYVPNLLLVKNRKVNLRVYMLVVCHHGNIDVYLHRFGKCIYTNKDYSTDNLDLEQHLTSLNLSQTVYQNRPQTFSQLKQYLGQGQFKLLMDNIVKNLILVMKAARNKICKLKSIQNNISFQLFGLDYVFTDDMYPYLLEMNKGPDMSLKNDQDKFLKNTVTEDLFKTVNIIDSANGNNFFKLNIS
jgi:hypothetical protein